MSSKIIAVSAAALLLGLATPSFAQSFTLNGTAVPPDQVERLQAYCDGLGTDATVSAEGSGSIASNENDSTADTESATGATSDDMDGSAGGDDVGAGVDFTTLDLATVDAAACRDGGFTADGTVTTAPAPAPTAAPAPAPTTTDPTATPGDDSLVLQEGASTSSQDGDSSSENDGEGGEGAAPSN